MPLTQDSTLKIHGTARRRIKPWKSTSQPDAGFDPENPRHSQTQDSTLKIHDTARRRIRPWKSTAKRWYNILSILFGTGHRTKQWYNKHIRFPQNISFLRYEKLNKNGKMSYFKWVDCSSMVWETWVQFQVASYQRLYKWYLIPPCLTLSNIRYVSRVNWSNPGKAVACTPTPRCRSYWKGSPLVALNYGRHLYNLCVKIDNEKTDLKTLKDNKKETCMYVCMYVFVWFGFRAYQP